MTTSKKKETTIYRTAILPELGRVQVPAHMSDAEVLSAVMDDGATPAKKTKKKP